MVLNRFDRLGLMVAAILTCGMLCDPAPPTRAQAPAHTSLAGQLLIAVPGMADPRFQRSVILMVRHDQTGAFGIVINRPVTERPLAGLLEALGDTDARVTGTVRIFYGGPVQPEIGFVVHSAEYRGPETIAIEGGLAVTSSREILRDMGSSKGPLKTLVAFGYAGWGPGQLEGELARRSWFLAPADAALVFDEERDKVWDAAMTRRTQDL